MKKKKKKTISLSKQTSISSLFWFEFVAIAFFEITSSNKIYIVFDII